MAQGKHECRRGQKKESTELKAEIILIWFIKMIIER